MGKKWVIRLGIVAAILIVVLVALPVILLRTIGNALLSPDCS